MGGGVITEPASVVDGCCDISSVDAAPALTILNTGLFDTSTEDNVTVRVSVPVVVGV